MPNVLIPAGQILSCPGPAGSPPVCMFADVGDPNVRNDPNGLLAGCALGSTYQRIDGVSTTTFLYVKTAAPVAGVSPTGTWTGK